MPPIPPILLCNTISVVICLLLTYTAAQTIVTEIALCETRKEELLARLDDELIKVEKLRHAQWEYLVKTLTHIFEEEEAELDVIMEKLDKATTFTKEEEEAALLLLVKARVQEYTERLTVLVLVEDCIIFDQFPDCYLMVWIRWNDEFLFVRREWRMSDLPCNARVIKLPMPMHSVHMDGLVYPPKSDDMSPGVT